MCYNLDPQMQTIINDLGLTLWSRINRNKVSGQQEIVVISFPVCEVIWLGREETTRLVEASCSAVKGMRTRREYPDIFDALDIVTLVAYVISATMTV